MPDIALTSEYHGLPDYDLSRGQNDSALRAVFALQNDDSTPYLTMAQASQAINIIRDMARVGKEDWMDSAIARLSIISRRGSWR